MTTQFYRIKDLSEITGVHAQTLRNWEREGLISPLRISGNHRLYTNTDIERVKEIIDLKESGYRIKGIQKVINNEIPAPRKETPRVENTTISFVETEEDNKKQKNTEKKTQTKKNTLKKTTSRKNKFSEKELSLLNIDELMKIAKSENITYFRQMRKEELITAIAHPELRSKLHEEARIRTHQKYGNRLYGVRKEEAENKSLRVAAAKLEENATKLAKNSSKMIPETTSKKRGPGRPAKRNTTQENIATEKESVADSAIVGEVLKLTNEGKSSEEIMKHLIENKLVKM